MTDLGALNGAPTYATSINDDGVISGYSQPDANSARAWIWTNGFGLADAGSFGGADNRGAAVGVDGKLYGYSQTAAGVQRGFVWDGVTLTDLGSLLVNDPVAVESVNANGTIVGSTTTGGNTLGFKMVNGTMTTIGTLPGADLPPTSTATDINDAGQIVGTASWIGGGARAFRTDGGGMLMSLGTLGANDSNANAINSAGDVVGFSTTSGNETHAFVYSAGVMRDLGVFSGGHDSRAYGINDSSSIVGSAADSSGNPRAFVWMPGGSIRDLNDLIPPNSGWVLKEARDINNAGDIVGYGTINGVDHAFLVERFDGPDTFAPVAVATVTPPGQGSSVTQVAVKFWDNEKVVSATARAVGAIRISGPNNYDMPGTAFMWTTNDSQVVNVSFNVPAPGGVWDPGDNGTYEVRVAANQVSDLAGNRHPGGVIATFSMGLQTAPTFFLSSLPTTTTIGTPVSIWVSGTSSYPSAVGDQFTYTIDWDGDGAVFENVVGTSGIYIPHTYNSLGTHVVRVRSTDPHGIQSSERSMTITVSNNPGGLPAAELLSVTPSGISTPTAAAVSGNTIYFAGGPFSAASNTIVAKWNYPDGAFIVANGDLDNGPILYAGAGTDGRGRAVFYGGGEAGGSSASARALSINGSNNIVTASVASMPASIANAGNTSDNLGRIYILSGSLYRYTAGASGAGTWATFAGPGALTPRCLAFDGSDRIIAYGTGAAWAFSIASSTWTQLPTPPINPGRAALGADGLVYLVTPFQLWIFDPVANTYSQLATTGGDYSYSNVLKGADGYLYFIGSYTIERFDTRASATQPPRIFSTPSVATVVQGVPWTYTIAASGKPRPTYSLVRGPAGMTVSSTLGVVLWTPALAQVGPQTALVRASNSGGEADQLISFNVLGTVPDTTPPTAPGNVTVLPPPQLTTTSADITWTASTDNVGVTGYRILVRRTAYAGRGRPYRVYYAQVGATAGLTWHFANLPSGSTTTYYLAAVDAAGNVSAYSPVTIKVLALPNIYSTGSGNYAGPYAIEDEPFTSANFSSSGNPTPTLTPIGQPGGSVWHASSGSAGYFTWTPAFGQAADANYIPPAGVAQPGLATFTLKASNVTTVTGGGTTGGETTQSYTLTVWPKATDVLPPNPVTGVVVDQVTADSCHVSWQPTTDNYGVVGYRVTAAHRAPRSRFHHGPYNDHIVTVDLPANATQTTFTTLRPSTSYTVTVIARDQNGLNPFATNPTPTGLWSYAWSSSGASFTTRPAPFAVQNVAQVTNADGSLTMTWPSQGYYWLYTVQCTDSLATPNWQPVAPASQWPAYITTFTFTPDANVPQRFYRVFATPGL